MAMIEARFQLTDHHGNAVTEQSYCGYFLLVFFGFTHCRVVCPRALSRISQTLEMLGDTAGRIQPLYVSVDPERDTPQAMKTFLENSWPRFTGLTGTREQVDAAKEAFRVFANRQEDDEDPDGYAVPHTAFTYLLDPAGNYVTHYADHWNAERVADDVRKRIA